MAFLLLLTNHYLGLYSAMALYQFTAIKEFSKFILLFSGIAWLLTVFKNKSGFKLDKSVIWFFLFLFWAAFTVLISVDFPKDLGLISDNFQYSPFFIGWNNIFQLALSCFIFIYIYNAVSDLRILKNVLRLLIIASTVVCFISIVVYLLYMGLGVRLALPLHRIGTSGVLHSANIGFSIEPLAFANQILLTLPLVMAMVLIRDDQIFPTRWMSLCFLVQLIALITTLSVGGLASFVVSTLFLLFLLRHLFSLKRNIVFILVFMLVILSAAQMLKNSPRRNFFNYAMTKINYIIINPHKIRTERADNNMILINMFKENPLTGTGFGSYAYSYKFYEPDNAKGLVLPYAKPNNDWLQILGETGLIGFLLFFTFIASILGRAGRSLKRLSDDRKSIVIGLMVSNIAIWVQALGGYFIQNAYVWVALALLLVSFKEKNEYDRVH